MSIKSITIKVNDMVCTSCEKRIDEKLKRLIGVLESKSNYKESSTYIRYDDSKCMYDEVVLELKKIGYSVSEKSSGSKIHNKSEIISIIGIIFVAIIIIKLGRNSGAFNMSEALTSKVSFVALFVIGVLTSLHCVGMCGGIMMSQSIEIINEPIKDKLKPALLYNLGRLISYTILGGIVGGIGEVFSLSTMGQAAIAIVAGLFMISMGFNMSGFKTFRNFSIKLPWSNCKSKTRRQFIIGLLNGFMPCGPLQTMQLYALTSGGIALGAVSMFFFALGTIPLMIIFGVVANILNQKNSAKLMKLSGIIIVVLGITMANRGLSLMGIDFSSITNKVSSSSQSQEEVPFGSKAIILDGKQTIEITAGARGYSPRVVYVQKDIPTDFIINGERITSCNNEINITSLNIKKKLTSGENVISFTPGDSEINYSCWMGMLRGNIKVVDDLSKVKESNSSESANNESVQEVQEPIFYGLPLSNVPSDRLVKITNITEENQSLNVSSKAGNFEPSAIVIKENLPLKLEFNLVDKEYLDGVYFIYNDDFTVMIDTFEIIDGKGNISLQGLQNGVYGIMKDNGLYAIIESVSNPIIVDIEEIRKKYF